MEYLTNKYMRLDYKRVHEYVMALSCSADGCFSWQYLEAAEAELIK